MEIKIIGISKEELDESYKAFLSKMDSFDDNYVTKFILWLKS
jgi:hypothetical protein